ncbi:hypothetical protein MPTK1_3g08640 [Marchantia polymorpha subsp. ruderalis]|nr:hypothetical protein MARPO_0105s0053 [Marchantia polymorpha]BBN04898.1 hypothetical protein Mp_3g08640 [Marchantia polymorpha subsp. ruderalis]|eukprot:PTQ31946.1 hypothetical protein MARPO_0105s0053 [Marchantia polymorpha]
MTAPRERLREEYSEGSFGCFKGPNGKEGGGMDRVQGLENREESSRGSPSGDERRTRASLRGTEDGHPWNRGSEMRARSARFGGKDLSTQL